MGSTSYAKADPPGTAGLPGHFTSMKTPTTPNRVSATPSVTQSINSRKTLAKLKDRFNESVDATSIRSLAKSNRSLTSQNLYNMHATRPKSQSSVKAVSYATTQTKVPSSKFNAYREPYA